jgi:hypothetical protein
MPTIMHNRLTSHSRMCTNPYLLIGYVFQSDYICDNVSGLSSGAIHLTTAWYTAATAQPSLFRWHSNYPTMVSPIHTRSRPAEGTSGLLRPLSSSELERLRKDIYGFGFILFGGRQEEDVRGLAAVRIHLNRMQIYYSDRNVFKGKLSGHDKRHKGFLEEFLGLLDEQADKSEGSFRRLYTSRIEPIARHYEDLRNRLQNQAAIDLLSEIVLVGNAIKVRMEQLPEKETTTAA